MPLIDPCSIVVKINEGPDGLCISLPGGINVCAQLPMTLSPPSGLQLAQQLLAQANAALAPLMPIFDIIQAVVAAKEFAESVPNPLDMAETLKKFTSAVDRLLTLVPQLSVPIMIVGVIDTIIQALDGLVMELAALQAQLQRVETAKATLVEVPALVCVINAAEVSAEAQFGALSLALAGINPVIQLANVFIDLVGLPKIPEAGEMSYEDLGAGIDMLQALVKTLQGIRGSIPV